METMTLFGADAEATATTDPGAGDPMEETITQEERRRFLAGLPEGQQRKVEKRLAEMPDLHHGIYIKAMSGGSRAAAVKAFCLECVGWQREEVRACTAPACPLFPYRPYKG